MRVSRGMALVVAIGLQHGSNWWVRLIVLAALGHIVVLSTSLGRWLGGTLSVLLNTIRMLLITLFGYK